MPLFKLAWPYSRQLKRPAAIETPATDRPALGAWAFRFVAGHIRTKGGSLARATSDGRQAMSQVWERVGKPSHLTPDKEEDKRNEHHNAHQNGSGIPGPIVNFEFQIPTR